MVRGSQLIKDSISRFSCKVIAGVASRSRNSDSRLLPGGILPEDFPHVGET